MSMCCVQRIRNDTLEEVGGIKGTNGRVGEGGTTSLKKKRGNSKGKRGAASELERVYIPGLPPNAAGARGWEKIISRVEAHGGHFSRRRVT